MNFELMLFKMHGENPFCIIITGDFHCRSIDWWQNDNESNEVRLFESISADLGLHQLVRDQLMLRLILNLALI